MGNKIEASTSRQILFVRRIALVGITQLIASLKGIILLAIITKFLGVYEYGVWSQVLVTVAFIQPIIQLGLGSANVRFLSSKSREYIVQGILASSVVVIITSTISAVAVYLLSGNLADLFLEASASNAFAIGSVLIIVEALNNISIGSFRVLGLIKRFSFTTIIQIILELSLVATAILLGFGINGAIWALVIARLVTVIVIWSQLVHYAGFIKPDFSQLREFLYFSIPLIPAVLFETIMSISDRYIIGYYGTPIHVGTYTIGYNIGAVLMLFIGFVSYILAPTVSKLYNEYNISEVSVYLTGGLKYMLMILIPATFGLIVIANPLLSIISTQSVTGEASIVLSIIALSMIAYCIYAVYGQILKLKKKTKIFTITLLIAAMINLGLNIIFIPIFGFISAAVTTFVSYLLSAIIIYIRSRDYIKIAFPVKATIKYITAALSMAVILILMPRVDDILTTALSVIFGVIIYFIVLIVIKGISKQELNRIRSILKFHIDIQHE